MKVVLQRSKEAACRVGDEVTGEISSGLVLFVGIHGEDTEKDLAWMAEKVSNLRVFEDEAGKMNRSVLDVGGRVLSIPQFTLYGNTQKGRRPNFMEAAPPEQAKAYYLQFNELLAEQSVHVETGVFGADMDISLTNDGPVTLILDSPKSQGNG
ncbi:D-aminoacyl-tRNA deacylase [Marinococcus sp. PL1-022]|uniref:D-aminoacyl-tRNA deacylase n=1 Tax=Marinococcus sp. PL1-022 TaxID=3095363 RepID=UPI00260CE4DF|nr:D-aminoacyl-tRNA deacylase [Marinococcus sp. PL1-022]MDX6153392.1 D-aminoacyl-tRNA deacylase [Marinococcus sp. PL1-022]